jgi:hypothetical protein
MTSVKRHTFVLEVDEDEGILTLGDGSRWNINPEDVLNVVLWLPSENVSVEQCDDEMFSHKITNIDNQEQVLACPL